jgi:C-terminal processing protease CtpA/Prc
MKLARTLVMLAGALALLGIAPVSAQQAPTITITLGGPYDAAYHRSLDAIKNNFLHADSISSETWGDLRTVHGINNRAELDAAVAAAILRVGNGHISVLTATDADQHTARAQSGWIGFGVTLKTEIVFGNEGFLVEEVEDLSPAQDAGLKVGDRIVAVNGTRLEGRTLDEGITMLRGRDGDHKVLSVVRQRLTQEFTVVSDVDGTIGIRGSVANRVLFPAVESTYSRGSAAIAGIRANDRILSINGVSTQGTTYEQAHKLLEGPLGASVTIVVQQDGEARHYKMVRGVVSNFQLSFDSHMGGGWGAQESGKPYAVFRFHHLDFAPNSSAAEAFHAIMERYTQDAAGMVLDLRGTSGNDHEMAARIAAHFVEHGIVLPHYRGSEGNTYFVNGQGIQRAGPGPKTEVLAKQPPVFKGKVAVMIDLGTSGAALALAHALSEHGATLVGLPSSAHGLTTSAIPVRTPDGEMTLLMPTAQMTTQHYEPLPRLWPDHLSTSSSTTDALVVLSGQSLWSTPERVVWSVTLTLGALLLFGMWVYRKIRGPRPEQAVEEEVEDAEDEASDPETDERPTSFYPLLIAVIAMIALLVASPWYFLSPPSGTHGEVIVELTVDDSDASRRQAEIVEQVKKAYSGSIRFATVHLRDRPGTEAKGGPAIRVSSVWYDGNGKEIRRHTSGAGYLMSRRHLAQMIAGHARKPESYWPNIAITRVSQ